MIQPGITLPATRVGGDDENTGLAIVREIVEAHGWSIAPTAASTGGARVEVTGVEPA